MTTPIERLRAYLREEGVPEGTPYRLFEMTDKDGHERVGVLYCAPEVEQSDEHCPECRDEVLGARQLSRSVRWTHQVRPYRIEVARLTRA